MKKFANTEIQNDYYWTVKKKEASQPFEEKIRINQEIHVTMGILQENDYICVIITEIVVISTPLTEV